MVPLCHVLIGTKLNLKLKLNTGNVRCCNVSALISVDTGSGDKNGSLML